MIHGLCRQEKDGRYVFNAPYYGRGSQINGVCHAADCELLDPNLLNERVKKIVYTEHYYPGWCNRLENSMVGTLADWRTNWGTELVYHMTPECFADLHMTVCRLWETEIITTTRNFGAPVHLQLCHWEPLCDYWQVPC